MSVKLSNQALGAVMLALQNSLLQQSDIVPVLKRFELELNEENELVVLNPPTVRAVQKEEEDEFKFISSDS